MDPFFWGILTGTVLLAFALGLSVMWFIQRRRRSRQLRERFGPEYDRLVSERGNHTRAEDELLRREQRVRHYDIRPIPDLERERYAAAWRDVQADFVDAPADAVARADDLVAEVMSRRGYPVADFEERAADLSVDHPHVVEHYRAAHGLAERSRRSEADTEDLRQAMVHYRALFEDLLERRVTDGRPSDDEHAEVRK